VDVGRVSGLGSGDTDAEGDVKKVRVDSLDKPSKSACKLGAKDNAVDAEGEYDSVMRSRLKPPELAIDGIDSGSDIEIVESGFLTPGWTPSLRDPDSIFVLRVREMRPTTEADMEPETAKGCTY